MQSFLFKSLMFFNIFLLSLYAWSGADDYYVTPTGTSSTCGSFVESCSFQKALDNADTDGRNNTIHVGAGTYNLAAPLTFDIQESYSLTIEGYDSTTAILDGGLTTRLLNISRTLADDSDVNITIRNLTFQRGNSGTDGHGLNIYQINYGTVVLEYNRFLENGNDIGYGGGVYLDNYWGNSVIRRNIFRDNSADDGGGMYFGTDTGHADILDNEFTNNSVSSVGDHNGGGLYTYNPLGVIVVANNIFTKNSVLNNGGGYYSRTESSAATYVVNNTLTDNSAQYGGGLYVAENSDTSYVNIQHNIIWGNQVTLTGDDVYINNDGNSTGAACTFTLNLYGEEAIDFFAHVPAKVTVSNNIRKNPLLAGAISLPDGRRSLRLLSASPAINAGDVCTMQTTDYEGAPRIQDGYVNLGAVEAIVPVMPPIYYLLMH